MHHQGRRSRRCPAWRTCRGTEGGPWRSRPPSPARRAASQSPWCRGAAGTLASPRRRGRRCPAPGSRSRRWPRPPAWPKSSKNRRRALRRPPGVSWACASRSLRPVALGPHRARGAAPSPGAQASAGTSRGPPWQAPPAAAVAGTPVAPAAGRFAASTPAAAAGTAPLGSRRRRRCPSPGGALLGGPGPRPRRPPRRWGRRPCTNAAHPWRAPRRWRRPRVAARRYRQAGSSGRPYPARAPRCSSPPAPDRRRRRCWFFS
mmetsp:Transcript_4157/g.13302  ORF Transcript_4157/g.13302 Transcript_4157/m.13302 type:complete len:260 (+) Transcript_4157:206-985(+)